MSTQEQTFQETLSKMASVTTMSDDEKYLQMERLIVAEMKPTAREIFVYQLYVIELAIQNAIPYTLDLDDNAGAALIAHMRAAAGFVMMLTVPPETNLLVHDYVVAVKRIFEPFVVLEAFTCDTALTVCENGMLYMKALCVAFG